MIKDYIICFEDITRATSSLNVLDVFTQIAGYEEYRNLKVVRIFHQGKVVYGEPLEQDDRVTFLVTLK